MEEFVEGHEGFYDTLSVNGEPALDFVSALLPERAGGDAHPVDLAAVRRHQPGRHRGRLPAAQVLGRRVNEALGIGTTATHMEWFFGPEGAAVLRDRLPAAGRRRLGPLLGGQRDRPLPRVGGRDRARPRSGTARRGATRPASSRCGRRRTARSRGYSGVDEMQARLGEWVLDAHLPPAGTPTQPVEAGYMANAYVRMRHPDYDVLRGMLDDVGRTVTSTPGDGVTVPVTVLGPQRRPTLAGGAAARADGRGRHRDRRLAGARGRRRGAGRRCSAAGTRQPAACTRRWQEVLDARPRAGHRRAEPPGGAGRAAGALRDAPRPRRAGRRRDPAQRRPAADPGRRAGRRRGARCGWSTSGTWRRVAERAGGLRRRLAAGERAAVAGTGPRSPTCSPAPPRWCVTGGHVGVLLHGCDCSTWRGAAARR